MSRADETRAQKSVWLNPTSGAMVSRQTALVL